MQKPLALLSLLCAAAFSTAAFAQGPREACRQDAQKLCEGIQGGGGRIKNCLLDHYKDLSDDCYTALKNMPQGGGEGGGGHGPAQGEQGSKPSGDEEPQ